MADENNESQEEEKGSSKLILIIGVVVALAGGGAFFMLSGGDGGEEAKKEIVVEDLDVKRIEKEITISFYDGEGEQHYLLLSVSYLPSTTPSLEYMTKKEAVFRQRLNKFLLGLGHQTIKSADGINVIRAKILEIMNIIVKENKNFSEGDKIIDTYIEKYIVQ